jgi:Peptidase_C39 like family
MFRFLTFFLCVVNLLAQSQAGKTEAGSPDLPQAISPPPSLNILAGFTGNSWPGSKAEGLISFAKLPNGQMSQMSAVDWKVTNKKNIYHGLVIPSKAGVSVGDYKVRDVIAVSDQVHVQHLWVSVDTRDPKAEQSFKSVFNTKFGNPKSTISYRKNGDLPVNVTTWVDSNNVAYALEATYSNEGDYYANGVPMEISIHTFAVGDIVSLFFDTTLFSLSEDELRDRLALIGCNYNSGSAKFKNFFGLSGTVTCRFVADKLQALQLTFDSGTMPDAGSRMVVKTGKSVFLDTMKELINQQIRSFPTSSITINSKDTPTLSLNSYPVGKQSKSAVNKKDGTLTSVGEQSFQNETKLTWSPKSWEGNYMLSGRKLTAYPPGYDIATIINPALGTLVGQTSIDKLKKDIPLFVEDLDFDYYASNLIPHPEGGVYLDIPMINQKDTAYCAPASMARILNYYKRNVDMHDVAKVAGSDITKGTNGLGVIEALIAATKKLDIICDKYGKPANINNFQSFINQSIMRGVPLIWGIPDHMRIINGYDPKKNEVIYTDSWGTGYERRRMSLQEAYKIMRVSFPKMS